MRPKHVEAGALRCCKVGHTEYAGQNGTRNYLLCSKLREPFGSLTGCFVVDTLEGIYFAVGCFAFDSQNAPIVKPNYQIGSGIA